MTLNAGLTTEIQKLAPSAIIELFELDCTSLGGEVLRFHAGTNQLSGNIVWQGNTYVRYPIQVSGFEYTGQGQIPRPKLLVSNILSAITTLTLAYGDLIGAKLTRKRTLAKFLDAENFTGGVNPNEDTTAEFENDIYFVDRKSNEDRDIVEFELASSMDLVGVKLPRRQIIQNLCQWRYRGSECGYTGGPVFDANDEVITSASSAEATALLAAYNAMMTAKAAYDVSKAAYDYASKVKDNACALYRTLETRYTYGTLGVPTYGVVISSYSAFGQTTTSKTAYWNGVAVTLGSAYSIGSIQYTDYGPYNTYGLRTTYDYYSIKRRGYDSAACTTATTAYNAAQTDYNTKKSAYNTAVSNYSAAIAALPEDDPIYLVERCGKRLSSCELRFPNSELPFGGFPATGLFK